MLPCAKKVTDNCDKQQIVGGSEHTLRAKLTFSQESHGRIYHSPLICFNLNILVDFLCKLNFVCFSFLLIECD